MKEKCLIINRLIRILEQVKNKLPDTDMKNIQDFLEHQEWGLAYETFCTQLYEYDIHIPLHLYKEIVEVGKLIQIQSSV